MISDDDIEKLASLARLELEDSMKTIIAGQVNSILEYVQQLSKVDTATVQPMSHTREATNVLRDDAVCPAGSQPEAAPLGDSTIHKQATLGQEDLLLNAPDHSGQFFRVPLIVE
jgi:aspartyl-tRNA(Asn)/glutamyl-tRNA(Gln) amidotransferase subunit C